jgi:hypothetical protein
VREAQLIARLADRFDIELVAVTKDLDKDRRGLRQASALGVRARLFHATSVQGVAGPHARRHGSASARRHLWHRSTSRTLRETRTDVFHVEGHYLMPLLPRAARMSAVLVEHNIESSLFLQAACSATVPGQGLLTTLADAALTRVDERRAWRTARMVVGVTPEDVDTIADVVGPARVRLVPNGADHVSADHVGTDSAPTPLPDVPGAPSSTAHIIFVATTPTRRTRTRLVTSSSASCPRCASGSVPSRWCWSAPTHRTGSATPPPGIRTSR